MNNIYDIYDNKTINYPMVFCNIIVEFSITSLILSVTYEIN